MKRKRGDVVAVRVVSGYAVTRPLDGEAAIELVDCQS